MSDSIADRTGTPGSRAAGTPGDLAGAPSPASTAVRLAFDDVSHTFPDGTDVLHHVSLTVSEGEFLAVIGPSGCGKSTMLRLASGLLQPSAGRIESEHTRIGFVFQEPTLLPYRTVLSNTELFGELQGIPKAERRRLALDALRRLGLEGFENKYPKALSGGMKMRASLARSLILHPTLYLFDEPFAAVDEITRQRLNDELTELFSRERFAAVFITHSVTEACYLASRVLVMSRRPARVLSEIEIPFPFPRTEELRFAQEFSECAREVSARLRESGV